MEHFLSAADPTGAELRAVLDLADEMKADRRQRRATGSTMVRSDLHGRTVALLFEKPSLRTRVSFEVGVHELGGHTTVLGDHEIGMGERESVADAGRVLGRYVDAIVLRTFSQERLRRLAAAAGVPVINALSDHEHPCQAVADLQTLREAHDGRLAGLRVAWVGDGNNVAHSLILAAALLGVDVAVAHPDGYAPDPEVCERARRLGKDTGASLETTADPADAAAGADAVYTDVWTSMGQEEQAAERAAAFAPYRVTEELFADAHPGAIFLHCLPAHRGEEVTGEVLDGPRSRVLDQAENRLHAQKALLATLLVERDERRRGGP